MSMSTSFADRASETAQLFNEQAIERALVHARSIPSEAELLECFFRFGSFKEQRNKRYFSVWSMVEAWRKARQHSIGQPFELTRETRLRLIAAWTCRATRVTH